jgi:hypothetical protein
MWNELERLTRHVVGEALDVDLEILMTSFLVPFISSWNGTGSLLQDLGVVASAHDLEDYKVHRDIFPQPAIIW